MAFFLSWKVGSDQGAKDTLDDKFSCRDQIGVDRVLRPKKRIPLFNQVTLERHIPVDQGRDDVTVPRGSVLQDDDITLKDPRPDH